MSPQDDKQNVQLTLVPSANEVTFYCNMAMVAMSPEECILHFLLRSPAEPSQAKSLAQIYISPAHAKRLAISMMNTIAQYERDFGIIKENPEDHLTDAGRERLGLEKK